jgi:hypothetical protein
LSGFAHVIVLENHNETLAKYQILRAQLEASSTSVHRIGLSGIPSNGQPAEVLKHHNVDADALKSRIVGLLN